MLPLSVASSSPKSNCAFRLSCGAIAGFGASLPPPPFQQKVRLAFFTGDGNFSRHPGRIMGMLTADHDGKVSPANPVANFPSPVLIYPMLHRLIRDAEWRFVISGLSDQVSSKVVVVIVVKTDENTLSGHRQTILLVSSQSAMSGARPSVNSGYRAIPRRPALGYLRQFTPLAHTAPGESCQISRSLRTRLLQPSMR